MGLRGGTSATTVQFEDLSMSVSGDSYSVEIERKNTHGAEWIFLKDPAGRVRGCRWHTDASDREIAFALRALSDNLDPRPPKFK